MVVVQDTSLKTMMNARMTGSGTETIVLAHGFGGDQSIWNKMIPLLAQRYRVVVFDWRFSGAAKDVNDHFDLDKCSSYDVFADDLITLLEEMKLSSCVFVGHSMSGMVGCLASIKRPDLFSKLILLGASPRYLNDEDYEGGFELKQIHEIFANIESNFQTWATFFASLVVDANDPLSVEQFKGSLCRMRPDIALSLAKTVFLSDCRGSLEEVQVPCTIVQVANDIVVPNSVVDYMQKKIKGKARVEIIEGHGHFPQLTNTEQLIDVIDRIMSSDTQGENLI